MEGLCCSLNVQVAKRVDDTLIDLIKYGPTMKRKELVEGEKEDTFNALNMILLALKSKTSATFKLNYADKIEF